MHRFFNRSYPGASPRKRAVVVFFKEVDLKRFDGVRLDKGYKEGWLTEDEKGIIEASRAQNILIPVYLIVKPDELISRFTSSEILNDEEKKKLRECEEEYKKRYDIQWSRTLDSCMSQREQIPIPDLKEIDRIQGEFDRVLEREYDFLNSERKKLEKLRAAIQDEQATINNVTALKVKLAEKEQQLKHASEEQNQQFTNLKGDYANLESNYANLKGDYANLESNYAQLKEKNIKLQESIDLLEESNSNNCNKSKWLHQQLCDREKECDELKKKISTFSSKYESESANPIKSEEYNNEQLQADIPVSSSEDSQTFCNPFQETLPYKTSRFQGSKPTRNSSSESLSNDEDANGQAFVRNEVHPVVHYQVENFKHAHELDTKEVARLKDKLLDLEKEIKQYKQYENQLHSVVSHLYGSQRYQVALALVSLQSQKPPVASPAAVESLVTRATAQIVPVQQFNSEFQLPFDQNMHLYDLFKELQTILEGPISSNGVYSITFIHYGETANLYQFHIIHLATLLSQNDGDIKGLLKSETLVVYGKCSLSDSCAKTLCTIIKPTIRGVFFKPTTIGDTPTLRCTSKLNGTPEILLPVSHWLDERIIQSLKTSLSHCCDPSKLLDIPDTSTVFMYC